MALIKCPECHSEVSESARACPKCGYAFSGMVGYTSNQYKGKKGIVVGKLIAAVGAILFASTMLGYVSPTTGAYGLLLLIVGITVKNVGKFKNWYNN